MKKLEEKVAVITGGAMGNGLGITKVFLNYNAKIAILDYADTIYETIESLKREYKDKEIIGYQVDIRDREKVKKCLEEIYNHYKQIDILINNAGVCHLETFENMTEECNQRSTPLFKKE